MVIVDGYRAALFDKPLDYNDPGITQMRELYRQLPKKYNRNAKSWTAIQRPYPTDMSAHKSFTTFSKPEGEIWICKPQLPH